MMAYKRETFRFCLIVLVPLFVGVVPRMGLLSHPHREGDEAIYAALIEQIESGAGYTLKGHSILDTRLKRSKKTYETPLFFHPPVGPYSFWLAFKMLGESGPLLIQLFYYAVYFVSMMLLFRFVIRITDSRVLALGGFLLALTPIPAHVNMKLWIDNPKLAFAAFGTFVYLGSVRLHSVWLGGLAGMLIGVAVLTKLDTLIFAAGLVGFAFIICSDGTLREHWRMFSGTFLAFCAGLLLVVAPWFYYHRIVSGQWITLGAGTLADPENRFLTLVFSLPPHFYLTQLLQISTSLAPAVLICLTGVLSGSRLTSSRKLVAGLLGWLLLIILSYIALAYLGIARLLRYEILGMIPALLIIVLALEYAVRPEIRKAIQQKVDKRLWKCLLGFLTIGYLTELFVGLMQMVMLHQKALILGIFDVYAVLRMD